MENYDKNLCHEIEASIKNGSLDLSSLPTEQLKMFLDYLCDNDKYEDECFYKCTDALIAKDGTDYKDTALELMNAAMDQYDALFEKTKHRKAKEVEGQNKKTNTRFSKKKIIAISIAAVFIVALLAITATVVFNPFSEFGITIREFIGLKPGDSLETESKELIAGGKTTKYASFEELCAEFGTDFFKIGAPFEPANIYSSNNEQYTDITIAYHSEAFKGSKSTCSIYLNYNTPPFDKEAYASLDMSKSETYNSHKFIVMRDEGTYQAMLFDSDRIYTISANSNEELELALNSFDK